MTLPNADDFYNKGLMGYFLLVVGFDCNFSPEFIVVHLMRGLDCLHAHLFCVSTESSIFYIFMLYTLIHTYTVLAVRFVLDLWNRVYNLCTLYVVKVEDKGYE